MYCTHWTEQVHATSYCYARTTARSLANHSSDFSLVKRTACQPASRPDKQTHLWRLHHNLKIMDEGGTDGIQGYPLDPVGSERARLKCFIPKFCPKLFLHCWRGHWGGWTWQRQHICWSRKIRKIMDGWTELCHTRT